MTTGRGRGCAWTVDATGTRGFDRLAYTDSHLDGDLSVIRLSGVGNFSAFHFHRAFTGSVGVSGAR